MNNAAYDISEELDPVEKLDDVAAKLEAKRKAEAEAEEKKKREQQQEPKPPEVTEAEKEAQRKKREQEKARQEKEKREQKKREREEELAASPWVTSSHKVRKARVDFLDRLYLRMKADDVFTGSKQEFYDEGHALLEEKYRDHAVR